ncbi:hypothetical protein LCGC14_0416060 [marine sediment metagenome]|uniref:Uncharacterized protein n=1 Tax=marine sediment metagenome TaxID=412755 RepID=A0A0F9SSI4_9ZZZZ
MQPKPDAVMFSLAEIKRAKNKLDLAFASAINLIGYLEEIAKGRIRRGESRGVTEKYDFLRLCDVGKFVAELEGGKPTTRQTIYRWIRKGRQDGEGKWIKLNWLRREGKRGCTKFQIRKFLELTKDKW